MIPSGATFVALREENGGSREELANGLELLKSLLKTYGNKLMLPAVQDVITKEDAGIGSLMQVLHSIGKLDLASVNSLLGKVAGSATSKQVTIKSSAPQVVSGLVDGAEVVPQESVGLTVQGSQKIYKRSLDRDLDKVLGK